jgi:hypothetical protein
MRSCRRWRLACGKPRRLEPISLGGRITGERHDYNEGVVVVMADAEEHEFCLVQYY